jgi:hypothetical protein
MVRDIPDPSSANCDELRVPAAAFEREASDRYREFQAWFAEHGLAELGALCGRLATAHGEDGARIDGVGARLAEAQVEAARNPWIGASDAGAELFYGLATARQLVEIALAEETAAARGFDDVARESPDARARDLAAALGASSRRCARELAIAIDAASPPDWETLIAGGGGPCLALGAERRLRRT